MDTSARHNLNPACRHQERLNQRLRRAFLEGAEEDSRRRLGRGLTVEELERIPWHYPGDVVEERGDWGRHGWLEVSN